MAQILEKDSAIQAIIDATRDEDIALVDLAGSQVSGKPPANASDAAPGTVPDQTESVTGDGTGDGRIVLVSNLAGLGGGGLSEAPPPAVPAGSSVVPPAENYSGAGELKLSDNPAPEVPVGPNGPLPAAESSEGLGGDGSEVSGMAPQPPAEAPPAAAPPPAAGPGIPVLPGMPSAPALPARHRLRASACRRTQCQAAQRLRHPRQVCRVLPMRCPPHHNS